MEDGYKDANTWQTCLLTATAGVTTATGIIPGVTTAAGVIAAGVTAGITTVGIVTVVISTVVPTIVAAIILLLTWLLHLARLLALLHLARLLLAGLGRWDNLAHIGKAGHPHHLACRYLNCAGGYRKFAGWMMGIVFLCTCIDDELPLLTRPDPERALARLSQIKDHIPAAHVLHNQQALLRVARQKRGLLSAHIGVVARSSDCRRDSPLGCARTCRATRTCIGSGGPRCSRDTQRLSRNDDIGVRNSGKVPTGAYRIIGSLNNSIEILHIIVEPGRNGAQGITGLDRIRLGTSQSNIILVHSGALLSCSLIHTGPLVRSRSLTGSGALIGAAVLVVVIVIIVIVGVLVVGIIALIRTGVLIVFVDLVPGIALVAPTILFRTTVLIARLQRRCGKGQPG